MSESDLQHTLQIEVPNQRMILALFGTQDTHRRVLERRLKVPPHTMNNHRRCRRRRAATTSSYATKSARSSERSARSTTSRSLSLTPPSFP